MADSANDEVLEKASNYQNLLINNDSYEIESTILKISSGLGINSLGMDNLLENLSGGQRTKIILAKLLLENSDVLLLMSQLTFLIKSM